MSDTYVDTIERHLKAVCPDMCPYDLLSSARDLAIALEPEIERETEICEADRDQIRYDAYDEARDDIESEVRDEVESEITTLRSKAEKASDDLANVLLAQANRKRSVKKTETHGEDMPT